MSQSFGELQVSQCGTPSHTTSSQTRSQAETRRQETHQAHAQGWRSATESPWTLWHTGGSRQGHSRYTSASTEGDRGWPETRSARHHHNDETKVITPRLGYQHGSGAGSLKPQIYEATTQLSDKAEKMIVSDGIVDPLYVFVTSQHGGAHYESAGTSRLPCRYTTTDANDAKGTEYQSCETREDLRLPKIPCDHAKARADHADPDTLCIATDKTREKESGSAAEETVSRGPPADRGAQNQVRKDGSASSGGLIQQKFKSVRTAARVHAREKSHQDE